MKHLITMLCFLVGLAVYPQSNITSILNEECNFSEGCEFTLGCCDTDGLNHPDYPECIYPEFHEYYVTEDVDFKKDSFVLRNAHIEFRNGASLITNGVELQYTCNANITFVGGGGIFESIDQMNQTLSIDFFELTKKVPEGVKYEITDLLGRIVNTGITGVNTKAIRSEDQQLFLIVEGYKPAKIPFGNNKAKQ